MSAWCAGPEAEDIGTLVEVLAADLFGRHVRNGAGDGARSGHHTERGVAGERPGGLGQPEVQYFDAAGCGEHNVRGLDVAMDDAVAVGFGQRVDDLGGDGESVGR